MIKTRHFEQTFIQFLLCMVSAYGFASGLEEKEWRESSNAKKAVLSLQWEEYPYAILYGLRAREEESTVVETAQDRLNLPDPLRQAPHAWPLFFSFSNGVLTSFIFLFFGFSGLIWLEGFLKTGAWIVIGCGLLCMIIMMTLQLTSYPSAVLIQGATPTLPAGSLVAVESVHQDQAWVKTRDGGTFIVPIADLRLVGF